MYPRAAHFVLLSILGGHECSSPDTVTRFDERHAQAFRPQFPRGGKPCESGADHNNIMIVVHRRPAFQGGRRGQAFMRRQAAFDIVSVRTFFHGIVKY